MKEDHMDTVADERREERWEQHDREPLTLLARPRRRWLTGASAFALALATAAGGFYAGVQVEKGRTTSSAGLAAGAASRSTAGGLRATLAARFGAAGALAGSGSASGAGAAPGGFGGSRLGGFLTAGGNASFGTVSSVDGRTLYLTDASGNTVKVTLSRATKLSKSVSVSRHAVRPGDTVVVQGLKQHNGTLVATSVTDSGARAAGGAGGASAGGNAAGGGGLSSLFQSKGGG
jgi:hypothetical protein